MQKNIALFLCAFSLLSKAHCNPAKTKSSPMAQVLAQIIVAERAGDHDLVEEVIRETYAPGLQGGDCLACRIKKWLSSRNQSSGGQSV